MNKIISFKVIPLLIGLFLIIKEFEIITFNLLSVFLIAFYIIQFFTLYFSNKIKKVIKTTTTGLDDRLDNHCIFGLTNTLILMISIYLLMPELSLSKNITLTMIIFIIYLILDRLTRVYFCYHSQKNSQSCYSSKLISNIFCYYSEEESKDQEEEVIAKPLQAFLFSIQVILFFGMIVSIYVFSFENEISKTILQSSGIAALAIGFLFKGQLNSMIIGAKLFFRDGFHVGDWIEVPEMNIDGVIIEITSFSVIIENWDYTKTNIPLEKFIDKSYKNWRHIKDRSGRRIKRSIYIDQHSVKSIQLNELTHFKNIPLLKEYIEEKENEIKEFNENSNNLLQRELTNIGLFRIYIKYYLKERSREASLYTIHNELTTLVRQLPSLGNGIPIEIYTFTNTSEWIAYEEIQADIFDHLLCNLHKFELKVYQRE